MRNLKKLLAVILTVAMMVTMVIPAFAADTAATTAPAKSDVEICKDLGVLKGSGDGVTEAYLEQGTKKIQAAILQLRLLNLEAEALAFTGTENFKDADKLSAGNKAILAYLKAHPELGWNGNPDGTFGVEAKATAQMLYKVLLVSLDYEEGVGKDFEWAKVIEVAGQKGLTKLAALTELKNSDVATGLVEGLRAKIKDGSKTLVEKLVADKVIDAAKAEAVGLYSSYVALDVASAKSISNTKIKLTLKTAAIKVDAAKFAVTDSAKTAVAISSVVPSSDMKTVYINTASMVPGAKYTLTVDGKEYSFISQVANTNKLAPVSAMAKNNIEVELTFSADVDLATALNAANYTIDNSLTVKGVTAGSTSKKVILTTSTQTAGSLYKITIANILDELGNGVDTTANLVYFGGKAADTSAPVPAASSDTNTRFKIAYTDSSDLDGASVLNTANYAIDGGLTISSIVYDKDADGEDIKNVAVITTSKQTAGALYTVTLNNIADKFANKIATNTKVYFGGKAADIAAPIAASAQPMSNKLVKISFTDSSKLDEATVLAITNYAVDNSLTISGAEYDATTKSVTLTTSAQSSGTLYKITLNNIKDEYGNTIIANSVVYFGGKAADATAPTFTAVSTSNTTVELTSSDNLDATTVLPYNFSINNSLGYALSATYNSATKKITLTTLPQVTGTVYTITVNTAVKNSDATAVAASTTTTFAGIGTTSTSASKLLAAVAIDNKNVLLTFDNNLATLPTNVLIKLNDAAGTAFDAATPSWYSATAKNKIVVRLNTLATKFVEGTLYKVVATGSIGANGIAQDTTYNSAIFGGIGTDPVPATILSALAIDNNTVKVYFDKPVALATGFTASNISLYNTASSPAQVTYTTGGGVVTAVNKNLSSDGKELTLYFRAPGKTLTLTEGSIYQIRFSVLADIKDAFSGLPITADSTSVAYKSVCFGAVSATTAGPQLLAVVPMSKYVLQLKFDVPVDLTETVANPIESALSILPISTGATMPAIKEVAVQTDKTKVNVYLNETGATAFNEGTVYTLRYTPTTLAYFNDAVDTNVKVDIGTGNTYKDVAFGALGTVAAGPAIAAIQNYNANTIIVALDQPVYSFATTFVNANIVLLDKDGTTALTNNTVIPLDDSTFAIIRKDGVFEAGQTYNISLTSAFKDLSNLRSADATVKTSIGGLATINLIVSATAAAPNTTLTVVTLKLISTNTVQPKALRVRDYETGAVLVPAANVTEAGTITIPSATSGTWIVESDDGTISVIVYLQ